MKAMIDSLMQEILGAVAYVFFVTVKAVFVIFLALIAILMVFCFPTDTVAGQSRPLAYQGKIAQVEQVAVITETLRDHGQLVKTTTKRLVTISLVESAIVVKVYYEVEEYGDLIKPGPDHIYFILSNDEADDFVLDDKTYYKLKKAGKVEVKERGSGESEKTAVIRNIGSSRFNLHNLI